MADRKPLLILLAVALVAIALFVVGVVGVGRGASGAGWPSWPSAKPGSGDQLVGDDLQADSSCAVADTTINFSGNCVVKVRPVTGGFPWERATRRAMLTAATPTVRLTITLVGKTLSTSLDPGKGVRLTFTRDGGAFALTCTNPAGCTVVLAKDI
ncbi:MAG: hypothetical protein IPM11_08570 [Micropruina sp.]|nr:hypothetical protein [Micropruina sp.]